MARETRSPMLLRIVQFISVVQKTYYILNLQSVPDEMINYVVTPSMPGA